MEFALEYINQVPSRVFGKFFDWSEISNLVYVVAAFAIYALIWWLGRGRDHGGDTGWKALCARIFDRRIYMHRSSLLDYKLFAVNAALFNWVWFSILLPAPLLAEKIAEAIGWTPAPGEASWGAIICFTVVVFLARDFGAMYGHYLRHRIPFFWEFHKIHHSAEVLNPLTAVRHHPLDRFFGGIPQILAVAAVMVVFQYAFDAKLSFVTFLGAPLWIFLFYLFGANLRHTQLWVSYGRFWSRIFISPAQHQIHHSADPDHYNTNFGQILAIWDWMLGTLIVPERKLDLSYGIEPEENAEYSSLWRLYWLPIQKACAIAFSRGGWRLAW